MKFFILFTFLLVQIALISASCEYGGYSSEYWDSSEEYKVDQPNAKICRLPSDSGPCLAYDPRYFFNKYTGKCERFVYGGCGGNKNNFQTIEECQQTCTDVCQLPSVVGPCKAAMPRFFFNAKTGKCEKFIYGGCGGNGNNFLTRESCEQRCQPVCVCKQPKVVGPCRGRFPRYYFNRRIGRCQLFYYSGCGGNGNNFRTRNECKRRCY